MTSDEMKSFDAIVVEALKTMREIASATVSTAYEVRRVNGEVIVVRTGQNATQVSGRSDTDKNSAADGSAPLNGAAVAER